MGVSLTQIIKQKALRVPCSVVNMTGQHVLSYLKPNEKKKTEMRRMYCSVVLDCEIKYWILSIGV